MGFVGPLSIISWRAIYAIFTRSREKIMATSIARSCQNIRRHQFVR